MFQIINKSERLKEHIYQFYHNLDLSHNLSKSYNKRK